MTWRSTGKFPKPTKNIVVGVARSGIPYFMTHRLNLMTRTYHWYMAGHGNMVMKWPPHAYMVLPKVAVCNGKNAR